MHVSIDIKRLKSISNQKLIHVIWYHIEVIEGMRAGKNRIKTMQSGGERSQRR